MSPVIGKIEPFSDAHESWTCYKERLEQYFIANGVADDKKVPCLLALVGPKSYQVLRDLASPDLPATKTFDELCTLLETHYNPKPLTIAERFRFHKRDQKVDESVQEYNVALRKLSEHCNFGDNLNDSLRDMFVCGLRNENFQKKLLAERDLTYTKAVEIAIAMEAATRDVKELHGQTEKLSINKMKHKPQKAPQKQSKPETKLVRKSGNFKGVPCYRCAKTNHTAANCRFIKATCNKCSKVGHIAPACRSNTQKDKVHQLDQTDDNDHENEQEEYLYSLSKDKDRNIIWVSPVING